MEGQSSGDVPARSTAEADAEVREKSKYVNVLIVIVTKKKGFPS